MSMNLVIYAEIEATFPNGSKRHLTETFDPVQTTTEATYAILAKEDRFQAYLEWVMSWDDPADNSEEAELDREWWGQRIEELRRWLSLHESEGWEITWRVV